jgi:hypothetical protein
MKKIRTLILAIVMALVMAAGVLAATLAPAQAYNWSAAKSVKDCSANACIQINYNTDLDGTGMLLAGVKIYATGGLGTVGHGIKCWNENSVIKWKVSSGTNLLHSDSSLAWSIGDIWGGAIKIVCRYDFDAEYVAGELPGQYAKAVALN